MISQKYFFTFRTHFDIENKNIIVVSIKIMIAEFSSDKIINSSINF